MVADYFCQACRTPFLNDAPLDENGRCGLCRRGLSGYDSAYAFGVYDGSLRELIHLFKYGGVRPLAGPLGRLLLRAMPRERRFDVVVPMPMHWLRRWRRGFNQSKLLARIAAGRLSLPILNAVRRRRHTRPQAGLTNSQRRANIAGAFAVTKSNAIRGRRVLLVDDVLTTGATAAACARALKDAGAKSVTLLVVARVDRRPSRLEDFPAAAPEAARTS